MKSNSLLSGPTFDRVVENAILLRHELHECPELGYREFKTSALVARELRKLRIPIKTGLAGGTGLVGLICGRGKRCVALRAEMDALPIEEKTLLAWTSRHNGTMHACGHDGHIAIILGAAALLASHKTSLKGQVKLLFQPAEEGQNGALRMCKAGVLNRPRVDAIFGLHGWPQMALGTAATRSGTFLAAVDTFEISIKGRGTHAAYPHKGIDPIACGAAIVQALNSNINREIDPTDIFVLTVGTFLAGSAANIIPDQTTLTGTLRTLNVATRRRVHESMNRICRSIGTANRCNVSCRFISGTPATVNSAAEATLFNHTASELLGIKMVSTLNRPFLWSEDFAYYLQRTAGCFFVLGVKPAGLKEYPMLHNPSYDFPDAAIPVGIRLMTALTLRYLAGLK